MVVETGQQPPALHLSLTIMKRRTRRSPAVGQAVVTPLSASSSHLQQPQSPTAALTHGARDFRKIYDDADDPVDSVERTIAASYSEELLSAFKRKTQELCDDTREQYEQKLERQEAQHARQVQNLQRQLREVVGSCVSLAEHEQIIATTAQEQQRQLRRRHQSELCEFEKRCEQNWQAKVAAERKEKSALMQRVEQLELQKSEAAAEAKERELSELRCGEKLEAASRAKEAVEQRVGDVEKRLEDACRIIVMLKTRLRHHARLTRDLESQKDEVMKSKLAFAALKGDTDTQVVSLERELDHAQRAMTDEKVNSSVLQTEVAGLREQLQRQQCTAVELTAKGALSAEHHAAERKQLQKEVEALRKALLAEQQAAKDATARLDKVQLQHQDLRTRLELQQTTEATLKRQVQLLKQRVGQFKAVVEKLHADNKQLDEEAHNRDASTEAWAKKLFGRQ